MEKYVTMTDVMNEILKLSRQVDRQKAGYEMAKLALRKITMAYEADINCLQDAIYLATETLNALDNLEKGGIIE
jgi:hypothetical protein